MFDRTKRTCCLAIMLLVLPSLGATAVDSDRPVIPVITDDDPDDYFPLHEGDRWIYQEMERPQHVAEVTVVSCYPWQGSTAYCVQNYCLDFEPGIVDFVNASGSTHQLQAGELHTWYPWANPTTPVVLPECCPECLRGTRGRISPGGTVQVPAGTFDDALRIEYEDWPCQDNGIFAETFAPEVGLVQRVLLNIAGLRTMDLVYATVGGVEYGSQGVPVQSTTWGGIKAAFAR